MRNIPLPRLMSADGLHFKRSLRPVKATVELNIIPLSTASLQMPDGDSLPARAYVEMFTALGSAGYFRVRSPQASYGDETPFAELEHAAVEIGDYLVTGKIQDTMTASAALQTVFGHYRGNLWQIASTSINDIVVVDIDHETVLSGLLAIMDQLPDYHMDFDFSTRPWTLRVVGNDSGVTAEGRLGRNVKSARITYDDSELCTRAYYEIEDEDGDGMPFSRWYTYDSSTIRTYGVVERVVQVDISSDEAKALRVVKDYLRKHQEPIISVEIDGQELSQITGESLDRFQIGKMFRLALPDYHVTVDRNITELIFDDVYGKPLQITVHLASELDTVVSFLHDVATGTGSSVGPGGGTKKQSDKWKEYYTGLQQTDYFWDMYARKVNKNGEILKQAGLYIDAGGVLQYADDNENMLYARLKVTASYIRAELTDAKNSLYSRIEQTASYIRSEVSDTANGLVSRIEQTASHLRTDFEDRNNQLYSHIEQTASYLRSDFEDRANGLYSRIEQTASYLRAEYQDTAASLRSEIEVTASHLRSDFEDTANGLYSRIDQTASYIRSEVSQTANGLSSRIDQNASQIALRVAKGDVATQLAVEAGNVRISGGNLVIDGYVTSSGLATEIGNISVLSVRAIALSGGLSSASGDIRTGGTVAGAQLYRGATDMGNAFVALSDPGYTDNSKTITFTKANGETETVTFSRAIDPNPDWSWINGRASVTLQPQNQTFTSPTALGVAADTVNHTVKTAVGGEASLEITCEKVSIVYSAANHNYAYVFQSKAGSSVVAATSGTTKTEAYDAGVTAGKGVMGVTADTTNHTVKVAESSTKSLAITCEKVSVVYSTANHNYAYVFQSKAGTSVVASTSGTTGTEAYNAGVTAGEGKFSLASVTLQGTGRYVTAINANAGLKVKSAVKYNAGSDYTLYEAGSSFSYNDVGSTTVYTRSNRMALKYVGTIPGKTGVFYKVDASGTNYYQTSEYTPTKRTGTRIGSKVTGTNLGSQVAVYVSASDGTQYYQAGATSYLYSAGSTVSNKYYTKSA